MPDRCPPVTVSGGRHRSPVPSTLAPMRSRGSATRSIGRDRNEASPVIRVTPGMEATTPARSRMPVPEFPRSRVAAGAASRWRPPVMRTVPPVDGDAGSQVLHGPEGPQDVVTRGETREGGRTVGQGGQEQCPVGDRLVPRHRHRPPRGTAPGHLQCGAPGGGHPTAPTGVVLDRCPLAPRAPVNVGALAASITTTSTPRSPSTEWAISMS